MNSSTVYDVTIFGLKLELKPVAFTLPIGDGWDVYWYGIIISLGFLAALLYCFKAAKKFELDVDRVIDVVLVATPAAIIFARLYYILFNAETSLREFLSIHNGGLAIYGGIIGAFAAAVLMSKVRKLNTLRLFDLAAFGFLIGQAVGRWGNFVNQEAYGGLTKSKWWGMTSTVTQRDFITDYTSDLVHPCFLYESLWCALGFVLLNIFKKYRKFDGELFLAYIGWYGLGRFFIEGLRTDSLYIGKIRVSQLVAALTFIAAVALIIILRKKALEKAADNADYNPIFGEMENDEAVVLEESGDIENDISDIEESEQVDYIDELEDMSDFEDDGEAID